MIREAKNMVVKDDIDVLLNEFPNKIPSYLQKRDGEWVEYLLSRADYSDRESFKIPLDEWHLLMRKGLDAIRKIVV